jgi:hypothetical protein
MATSENFDCSDWLLYDVNLSTKLGDYVLTDA